MWHRLGSIVLLGLWLTVFPLKGHTSAPQIPQSPAQGSEAARREAMDLISQVWKGDLDGMIQRRYVRVATTYSKTTYFIDRGVQRGNVYESMKLFENELNQKLNTRNLRVSVIFLPMSRDELLPAVIEGRADIAAATALNVTPSRQQLVDFSPPTRTNVDEIVVTGPGAPMISSVDDLAGREVFVRKSSAFHEHLAALSTRLKARGKAAIILTPAPETLEDDDILEMVNAGLVKITVVDNYVAEFWKQLLPSLVLHPDVAVARGGTVAVAMRKNSPQLMSAAVQWVKNHGPKTVFGNMMTRKYLQSTAFAKQATSPADLERFQQTAELFRKYGQQYELDYLLMAAQGFQESGLNQNARSAVGAIGVMQVMPATGKAMNVGDIRELDANIHAGVKYIRFLIDTHFKNEPMDELNKALFAFAAYDAGPARLPALREAAGKRGLNPNVWFDNVEQIASEKLGRETVTYVGNIFKYYVAYRLAMDEVERRKQLPPPPRH